MAARVQRRRPREDHEVEDDVRESHPRDRVHLDALELRGVRSLALRDGRLPVADLLLDLLARLPEEEVGRDGRSEDRDEGGEVFTLEAHLGDEGRVQHPGPIGLREECGGDVREEREREPLEDARDDAVVAPRLERDDRSRDRQDQRDDRHRHQQVDARGDRRDVRARVDRVGDDEAADRRIDDASGIVRAQDAGEPASGDERDLGAEVLHHRHERQRDDRGPQRGVAEGGPGHRICADAGRIVIGGTGN